MAKKTNPYLYEHEAKGKTRYGYRREFKGKQLRARGFVTPGEAEQHLNQAMADVEAVLRGEVRTKPTTAQDALEVYRRNLEVRGCDKAHKYTVNMRSRCKVLQEFVDRFGPTRLIRECTETDLREFYQVLCFRMARYSAKTHIGHLQGMLKAAQKAKPDLVNWPRPSLSMNVKTEYERRVVEPWELRDLVHTLLNPPAGHKNTSHKTERKALWRDTADVVVLLRLTGGRLNEVLRMKVDQFNWSKGTVRLYATKTESERDVPLTKGIERVMRARMREGLLSDEGYVFARASSANSDYYVMQTSANAARAAKLDYGRASGFTLHSLRHTFITDLMRQTNNDVGTVMKYSGHKTLESFSRYLHPSETGSILAIQALDNVDGILTAESSIESVRSVESVEKQAVKPLQNQHLSVR